MWEVVLYLLIWLVSVVQNEWFLQLNFDKLFFLFCLFDFKHSEESFEFWKYMLSEYNELLFQKVDEN